MIIPRQNANGKLFKGVKNYFCLSCKTELPLNTRKKFYFLNKHGWGYCKNCMRDIQKYQAKQQGHI